MARQPEVRYINAYISGSVAYQPERKPQKKQTVRLPKARKAKRKVVVVDVAALGGIVAAVVLAIAMIVNVVQLNQAQAEANQLRAYVESLQAENAQLQDTYASNYDMEEIRDIALTIGMVPAEQVTHLQMQMVHPQVVKEPTAWESFWAFMVGLFA